MRNGSPPDPWSSYFHILTTTPGRCSLAAVGISGESIQYLQSIFEMSSFSLLQSTFGGGWFGEMTLRWTQSRLTASTHHTAARHSATQHKGWTHSLLVWELRTVRLAQMHAVMVSFSHSQNCCVANGRCTAVWCRASMQHS